MSPTDWEREEFQRLDPKLSHDAPVVLWHTTQAHPRQVAFDMHYGCEVGIVCCGAMLRRYRNHEMLVRAGEVWRGEAVVLIKPQFEAGREHVGNGGIVREQAGRDIAIERVRLCVAELGGTEIEVIDSPIHGMEGNWEYLLHACFGGGELET